MILSIAVNPYVEKIYHLKDFQKGKTYEASRVQHISGGNGIRLARTMDAFNESVMVTGFIGGKNGEYLKRDLSLRGIQNNFVSINEETRSSIAILTEDGNKTRIFGKKLSISEGEVLKLYELFRNKVYRCKAICASEDLPEGLPPDIYANLILIAQEVGKRFFLSSNGKALKLGIDAGPFFVNTDRGKLEEMMGCKIDSDRELIQICSYLMENDIKIIIVSMEESMMAFHNEYIYNFRIPGMNIEGLSEAGGAIMGGFVASLRRDYDFEFAAKIAMACGMASKYEGIALDMAYMKKIMSDIVMLRTRI